MCSSGLGEAYGVGDHGREDYQGRHVSERSHRGPRCGGVAEEWHTWLFGIVGVEFGRETSSYSHLDEEDDRVQEGLWHRRRPGQRGFVQKFAGGNYSPPDRRYISCLAHRGLFASWLRS